MSDLTLPVRITAAKRLLAEGMQEYDDLPPQFQAYLQEAIEFLTQVETHLDGDGPVLEGDGSGLEGDGGKK